jgi:hypothetical protein
MEGRGLLSASMESLRKGRGGIPLADLESAHGV